MANSVRLPTPDDYWDRPASHCSQGDLYLNVPFVYLDLAHFDDDTAGTRTRPAGTAPERVVTGHNGPGVVLNYTCGFMAQPPGVYGYGHNFRFVAPLMSLHALVEVGAVEKDLRTVRDLGRTSGYMYVPDPWPDQAKDGDEWFGHAALLLYRPSLVTQRVLDSCARDRRLSEAAQQILVSLMVQQVSPTLPPLDQWDGKLDRSDGWPADDSEHAGSESLG